MLNLTIRNLLRRAGGRDGYLVACLCLLVVATALRFSRLDHQVLKFDEVVAVLHADGSFAEVLEGTRFDNTSPILHPLILYLVQKLDRSPFTLRALSALASALTVAVILVLWPRVGVSRGAAFLAGLMLSVSLITIEYARFVREYSLDALVAALLIYALLSYQRAGKRALLCALLFFAPLVQYGLVLSGMAILGAATIYPSQFSPHNRNPAGVRSRLKRRAGLLWPAACFLAGCALTYALTLRYQIPDLGRVQGFLPKFYYSGNWNDLPAILDFAIARTWGFLNYHLAPGVSGIAVIAIVILLLRAFAKRLRCAAYHVLFLLAIAIASCAALLGFYPFGAIRQTLYLTPALFLVSGDALHSLVARPQPARRAWLVAIAAVIVFTGAGRLRDVKMYNHPDINHFMATLEDRVQAEDLVYVMRGILALSYHQEVRKRSFDYSGNYYNAEESFCHWLSPTELACAQDIVRTIDAYGARRVWLATVHGIPSSREELKIWEDAGVVEPVIVDRYFGLWLAADSDRIVEAVPAMARQAYQAAVVTVPAARDVFDIHHDAGENILTYVREGCGRADTEARFFLHLIPADVEDLPEVRRQHGFDNHDFEFERRGGARFDGSCVVTVPLPDYAIERIFTGQFIPEEGQLWQVEFAMPGSR